MICKNFTPVYKINENNGHTMVILDTFFSEKSVLKTQDFQFKDG